MVVADRRGLGGHQPTRSLPTPFAHVVTYEEIRTVSPLLGSRNGLSTDEDSMEDIAKEIAELVAVRSAGVAIPPRKGLTDGRQLRPALSSPADASYRRDHSAWARPDAETWRFSDPGSDCAENLDFASLVRGYAAFANSSLSGSSYA